MTQYWKAPANVALGRIDIQNTFCPGGNLPVENGDEVVDVTNDLTPHFDTAFDSQDWHPEGHISFASSHEGKQPIIDSVFLLYERDDAGKVVDAKVVPEGTPGAIQQALWTDHAVQDTEDAAFRSDLVRRPQDMLIYKGTNPLIDSYSAFYENDGATQPTFDDGSTMTDKLREKGIEKVVFTGLAFDFCVGWNALDAVKDGFEAIVVKDATRSIKAPVEIKDDEGNVIRTTDTEELMLEQLAAAGVQVVEAADLPRVLGVQPNRAPQFRP